MKNILSNIQLIVAAATISSVSVLLSASNASAVNLVGQWTFEEGEELSDLTGNFDDLTLGNGATVSDGKLNVGVNQFAQAANYTGSTIQNKTLVSWLSLDDINVGSGSALTLQNSAGNVFDAIVYGERQRNRWMAGSNSFQRTQDLNPGFAETVADQLIQMAITYDDKDIKVYRDSVLIGEYTHSGAIASFGNAASALFGRRHSSHGGPGEIDATIEEARIYDGVLSQADLQGLRLEGAAQAVPEPSSVLGLLAASLAAAGGVVKKKRAA